jgi:hypothetical protein
VKNARALEDADTELDPADKDLAYALVRAGFVFTADQDEEKSREGCTGGLRLICCRRYEVPLPSTAQRFHACGPHRHFRGS